ncbi:hypothetical protein SELMODRAFT_416415 [Selaginella moellendorffii]|uniref:5'-3' exonuclease domain-containing protein n=1 Tax=Selaginella moellendorffii TaxID=88036 RepID=D8RZ77_SELML|nr:hypothetical protein SELMODRAFT_416415 [Selaginella moellendorffii]
MPRLFSPHLPCPCVTPSTSTVHAGLDYRDAEVARGGIYLVPSAPIIEAEYRALVACLHTASHLRVSILRVYGDSQLVVNPAECCRQRLGSRSSESPVLGGAGADSIGFARKSVGRGYVLDVHPLCYRGSKPDSSEFLWWMRAFLRRIVLADPVIAVFDGEFGNDYRRKILPSYKAGRRKFKPLDPSFKWTRGLEASFSRFQRFLRQCNIPVVKVDNAEADDVVTTLARQVTDRSLKAVIASPDKDFKQLDYVEQHKCEPGIELGLRKHPVSFFSSSELIRLEKPRGLSNEDALAVYRRMQ